MKYFIVAALVLVGVLGVFAWTMVSAQDTADNTEVLRKLDTVIANQKEMMVAVGSLKEEMRILKVRVTQAQ